MAQLSSTLSQLPSSPQAESSGKVANFSSTALGTAPVKTIGKSITFMSKKKVAEPNRILFVWGTCIIIDGKFWLLKIEAAKNPRGSIYRECLNFGSVQSWSKCSMQSRRVGIRPIQCLHSTKDAKQPRVE